MAHMKKGYTNVDLEFLSDSAVILMDEFLGMLDQIC